MSLAEAIKVTAVPNEPTILADIRKFFVGYGPTFVELADGERSDLSCPARFLRRAAKVHWLELPYGHEGQQCHYQ